MSAVHHCNQCSEPVEPAELVSVVVNTATSLDHHHAHRACFPRPFEERIEPWAVEHAEGEFVVRFQELTREARS